MLLGLKDPMCYIGGWDEATDYVNGVLTKGKENV